MKYFITFLLVITLIWVFACAYVQAETINPPEKIRQSNYGPSCAHAATITMLRWQGQPTMAEYWRGTYYGGEYFSKLSQKFTHAKLKHLITMRGDTRVLDYASKTRRGAVISWTGKHGGAHAVFFCGFLGKTAKLVDPNTDKVHTFDKEVFLLHWRKTGGRAILTLHSPPPKL